MASVNRGCSAIRSGGLGGVRTEVMDDGITRSPCVAMPNIHQARELKQVCFQARVSTERGVSSLDRRTGVLRLLLRRGVSLATLALIPMCARSAAGWPVGALLALIDLQTCSHGECFAVGCLGREQGPVRFGGCHECVSGL